MRPIRLLVLLLTIFSVPVLRAADEGLRVLFIGNSYSFQVPRVFGQLAESKGKKVLVEQVTRGGWTLKQHAAAEETRKKIAGAKWDYVVLQEQSQIPSFADAENRMGAAVEVLAGLAKEAGAELVFFETWGRRDGDTKNRKGDTFAAMQQRLTKGYAAAAKAAGGKVVPVGSIWAKLARDELWAKDGSHPSKTGTYLAACVFYSVLFHESPQGAEFDGGLNAATAKLLQEAAGTVAKPQ